MSPKHWLLLVLIISLAAFLRFWQLGQVPPSLDWDEASIGYNAYSLLMTGSDEYGTRFPQALRSFGDYKPPLYVYVTILSVAVFGLTEFAIRFPSALAGVLSVLATFFLVKTLCDLDSRFDRRRSWLLCFLATTLLAISPWHIQFSRVAFEANLALLFFISGGLFLALFLRQKRPVWFLLLVTSDVLAFYSYHSARLVVPIFLAGIIIYYRDIFWSEKKTIIIGGLLGLLLLLPLLATLLGSRSLQARFSEVSIFSAAGLKDTAKITIDRERRLWQDDQNNAGQFGRVIHSQIVTYARLLAKNYLDSFNFDFLFLNADGNGRHHAPGVGLLYLIELPFILAGAYFLLIERPKWLFFVLWWFLVAPLAAILTAETPHAIRSLLYLPSYQLFSAYGLLGLYHRLKKSNHPPRIGVLGLVCLSFLVNFFYYLHQYFVHLPLEYAPAWQFGYKEMVAKVQSLEKGYQEVYVSTKYDQPYIYFLLYGHANPNVKNDSYFQYGFGKYRFVNWGDLADDYKNKLPGNILTVTTPDDFFHPGTILDKILYPDKKVAFIIGHR